MRKRICPRCGSRDVAKIVYGEPNYFDPETMEKVERKEIFLEVALLWELNVIFDDRDNTVVKRYGINAYPPHWKKLIATFRK
ncbi:MAG: hypothetical protein ACK4R7_00325 [Fervidobacterium sp.]